MLENLEEQAGRGLDHRATEAAEGLRLGRRSHRAVLLLMGHGHLVVPPFLHALVLHVLHDEYPRLADQQVRHTVELGLAGVAVPLPGEADPPPETQVLLGLVQAF